jgi:rod shape-determining protein MreD
VAIAGVKPDLALVILVFAAYTAGPVVGEVSGFAVGLVQDFMSLPPLGFYALVRTLLGFFVGRLQGSLVTGPVVLPVILVVGGTFLHGALVWLLGALLGDTMPFLADRGFWIEAAYNGVLAPIVFALLGRIRIYRNAQKERVR